MHPVFGPLSPWFRKPIPKHAFPSNQEWAASNCLNFLCVLLLLFAIQLMCLEHRTFALRLWATQPWAWGAHSPSIVSYQPRMCCIEFLGFHFEASHGDHTSFDGSGTQNFCTSLLGHSALGLGSLFPEHGLPYKQERVASNCLYFLCRLLIMFILHLILWSTGLLHFVFELLVTTRGRLGSRLCR